MYGGALVFKASESIPRCHASVDKRLPRDDISAPLHHGQPAVSHDASRLLPCNRHRQLPLHLAELEGFLCYLSRLSTTSHSTEMFLQPGFIEKSHNAVKGPTPLPSRPVAHRDDARSMKRSSTPLSLHLSPSSSDWLRHPLSPFNL